MADPTGYAVTYSFSGFQVNSPTTPLPAPALDDELIAIAAATASLVSAIRDIRRSDGALSNKIVTFDSLADELQFLVDPTNGQLVAAAVAAAQANAALTAADRIASAGSASAALAQAVAAAASAASVNLSLYLAKSNNLAGLGSQSTSRSNLGLGSVAVLDAGVAALNAVQLDANAKLPAVDGSQLTNIDVLPVGTTIYVNSINAPPGTLKENGALLSRAAYPRLWTYAAASSWISTEAIWFAGNMGLFSNGDTATTFRIPDSRGEFLRAWDDGRGVDAGRAQGSQQADMLKDHTHPSVRSSTAGGSGYGNGGSFQVLNIADVTGSASIGGAETRPRNIPKLACIKY